MFSNTVYVAVWQPYNSTWARAQVTQMRRCTMTVIVTYRLVCREGAMCVWLHCLLLCLWLCVHVGMCTSCHVSLRWRHCLGRKRLRLRIDFLPFWLTMYDVSCCFVTNWSLKIIERFFLSGDCGYSCGFVLAGGVVCLSYACCDLILLVCRVCKFCTWKKCPWISFVRVSTKMVIASHNLTVLLCTWTVLLKRINRNRQCCWL